MQDDWYRPEIPRKELKAFTARDDTHALIDFGLWAACLALSGYAAYQSVGTYWGLPAFFLRHDLQFL